MKGEERECISNEISRDIKVWNNGIPDAVGRMKIKRFTEICSYLHLHQSMQIWQTCILFVGPGSDWLVISTRTCRIEENYRDYCNPNSPDFEPNRISLEWHQSPCWLYGFSLMHSQATVQLSHALQSGWHQIHANLPEPYWVPVHLADNIDGRYDVSLSRKCRLFCAHMTMSKSKMSSD